MTLKNRQVVLLVVVAASAPVVSLTSFLYIKYQETEAGRAIRRTTNYERVVKDQANATGPPLARVIAADSGEPVPGVIIGMTLIGPDGGDGGFQSFLTQKTGIACLHHPLTPGRYQYHLVPDPNSRFVATEWDWGQPYIVVAKDGTTTVPDLRLQVAPDS